MSLTRRGFLTTLAAMPLAVESERLVSSSNASAAENVAPAAKSDKALKFRDGKFKLIQFTDMHCGFTAERMKRAEETLDVVRKMLEIEKPDLAILTGDVVVQNPTALEGGIVEAWNRIAAPFAEAKIPFACCLGNHDHERPASAKQLLAAMQESEWNLTRDDNPGLPGAGNCSLPIYGADGSVKRRLWLFDSHSYPFKEGLSTYDWIKNNQIEWYRAASKFFAAKENGDAPVPGLAFFHIPLPEYWQIHKTDAIVGSASEPVCSPELNSGLFTAFVERGDVEGVFVGHDHTNDYIGVYKGIALAYGRKTGCDSYGDFPRGGRVIEFTEEPGFSTYVSALDGVSLNWKFPQE